VWRVGTKIDLIDSEAKRSTISRRFDLAVSAKTGEGMEGLVARLTAFVSEGVASGGGVLITRARHRAALTSCVGALRRAEGEGVGLEIRAEELRQATDALGRVTGRVDAESLLDVIFREFCIGK
jgi:tRNA modification GTPase